MPLSTGIWTIQSHSRERLIGMNRRDFIKAAAITPLAAHLFGSDTARYRIGYTTNTRGGWEHDPFLGFREAHEVGFRYVEAFIASFPQYYPDKPQELQKRIDEIGVKFVTLSNGGPPTEMHFEDPAKRGKIIDDHLRLVRFIKHFGCDHLKINTGPRRPGGTTDEDLKHMSETLEALGRLITSEGIKFGVHAHMWSQLENRHEIDFVMANTDPKHVMFVLDTGHITMAGIDPLELARQLGPRVVEYHIKDTKPETRGGAKTRLDRPDLMKDPCFFPLGSGGVDFPGLKDYLDKTQWRGFLTVELDTSPFKPPKQSASITRDYIVNTLKIPL
jgi:inosose dehydratase